jgi:mRNA interferase HicA
MGLSKEVQRMKVSEIVREIKSIGCHKIREGSNHEIWISPVTGRKFPVPWHYSKELPTGTEKSMRKKAGL